MPFHRHDINPLIKEENNNTNDRYEEKTFFIKMYMHMKKAPIMKAKFPQRIKPIPKKRVDFFIRLLINRFNKTFN